MIKNNIQIYFVMTILILSVSGMSQNQAFAATPVLGEAESFGILASTYTNTVAGTNIVGDVGYTTPPAMAAIVNGTIHGADATYNQAGIDQNDALIALNNLLCTTNLGTTVDLELVNGGIYSPGVYCSTGAMSIGAGGITITGQGLHVFRSDGALTTVDNSTVTLSDASSANVFWTPTEAITLGADSVFKGTAISPAGITIGNNVNWEGRALAFGGTISTDVTTLTVPTIDTIEPTVVITSSSGNSDSTVDSTTLSYTATFSDTVFDFILGDITVTGTANNTSPVASNFTGSGTTYTFDVLRGSSDGTVVVSIAADTAADINGNANTASNTYTLTIDTPSEVTNPPASVDTSYTLDNTSGGDTVPIGEDYALATLTVSIQNGKIAFDNTAFVGGIATLTTALTVNAPSASVVIPAGTTITGTGWDGVLTLPSTTSVSVNGFNTGLAIQFGDPDRKLTFSSPVSVTLPGQTGKSVFITEFDNTQNQVTVICDAEPPTNTAGFACYVDDGTDIVIYTETASTFSSGSPTGTSIDLGTSSEYAVLAHSGITNDPIFGDETVIDGKLGIHSGDSITGFFGTTDDEGPGTVIGGSANIEQTTAAAELAKTHATAAFTELDQACTEIDDDWPVIHTGDVDMASMTLGPGVYCGDSTIQISTGGVLTLDGPGVYIFKAGSALTTFEDSEVVLTNGATADDIFWRVVSDATLAAPGGALTSPTTFYGTVIATGWIHQTGGIDGTILAIEGRLISLTMEITFASSTTVTVPISEEEGGGDNGGDDSGSNSNGGSSKEWATKPTFGISYQTNKQFVTDGFGYNVFAKTITDNFHTGFSMVNIPTDTSYPLYAKGYFANQLKTQEFCFGIPETGKGYLAESCIEVHFDSGSGDDRKITDVQVIQDSNVINDVSVQHEMASCNTSDTAKVCDKTMITIAFAEPLQHSVMMIKGIDWKGKSTETYLNEGFNVNGKQLTDLPTAMIPGPTKYEGLIQVTQSEKYSNIWVSDDERMFERNSSGSFNQIKQTHERHQDTGDMKNRTHSAFAEWKDQQAIKAKNIWDSSKYVSTLAPSFAYDYPVEDSRTAFLIEHNMLEFVRGQ